MKRWSDIVNSATLVRRLGPRTVGAYTLVIGTLVNERLCRLTPRARRPSIQPRPVPRVSKAS